MNLPERKMWRAGAYTVHYLRGKFGRPTKEAAAKRDSDLLRQDINWSL